MISFRPSSSWPSQPPTSKIRWDTTTTLVVFLIVFHNAFGSASGTTTESELNIARSKWESAALKHGPLSYSFGLEETVKVDGHIVVDVEDYARDDDVNDDDDFTTVFESIPTIVRVDNLNNVIDICSDDFDSMSGGNDVGGDNIHNRNSLTVEGFFDRIETSIFDDEGERHEDVDVVFEEQYGYPLVVVFTYYETRRPTTGNDTATNILKPSTTSTRITKTYELLSFMIYTVEQAKLDAAKDKWMSSNIVDYIFTQSIGCNNCNPLIRNPKQLIVQGEKITRIVDEATGLEEEVVDSSWQLTVFGLFKRAQMCIDNQDYFIEFTVDEEFGFPKYLLWNHHPGLNDGSLSFSSWNLSATNIASTENLLAPFSPPVFEGSQRSTTVPSSKPSVEPPLLFHSEQPESSTLPSTSPSRSPSVSPSTSPSTASTYHPSLAPSYIISLPPELPFFSTATMNTSPASHARTITSHPLTWVLLAFIAI